mgnify:CR=1 FL=1
MYGYPASKYKYLAARTAPMLFLLLVGLGYLLAHPPGPWQPSGSPRHSKPLYRDESRGLDNFTASGDDYAIDDEAAGDSDTKLSFALFITLFAGLVAVTGPGFYYGVFKGSVNSFRYDSTFGYSPLRSPPSV